MRDGHNEADTSSLLLEAYPC